MRALNLDVAGEYLLLAATLLHIKSQLLLPNLLRDSDEEDDEDPRLGLVEHLVTYRTYQDAAQLLAARPQLGRDIFTKGIKEDLEKGEMVLGGWEEIELYDLLTAWQRVISRLQPPPFLEITSETVTLHEKIEEILERVKEAGTLSFEDLMISQSSRRHKVYAFLALLELIRRRLISAEQSVALAAIRIRYREGDEGRDEQANPDP